MSLFKTIPLFILLLFCYSCSSIRDDDEFLTIAPDTPQTFWLPEKKEQMTASEECVPLLPKEADNHQLTLAELIDMGLKNNPYTKESWASAKAAAAAYQRSLSSYYPEIDIDASVQRERQTYFNEFLPSGTKNTAYYRTISTPEMQLSYTIYDFGQRKYSSDMARYSLYYADWTHNQTIQQVIQLIMSDYYDFQYQRESLIAYEADLANAKESFDAAIVKFESGIVSVGDVAQAKTRYLQSQIDLVQQKKVLANSYATLINDLGLPANNSYEIELMPAELFTEDLIKNLDQLVIEAKEKRQDLKAAQALYKQQKANVAYARSEQMPVFNTSFDLGKNFYNDEEHEDYHFTLLFKLSFPLFRGFYYKNNIRNALANLKRSQANVQQTEMQVIKDVTQSQNDIQSANLTLRYSEQYLQAAETRFNIAMSNYKAGTSTILDLMSAQSDLADARAKKAQARKDWFTSLTQLAYSTGSLCSPFEQGEKK